MHAIQCEGELRRGHVPCIPPSCVSMSGFPGETQKGVETASSCAICVARVHRRARSWQG